MTGRRLDDLGQRLRRWRERLRFGTQHRRQGLGRVETIAQGCKVARTTAPDRQTLQRAFEVGRTPQRLAHLLAQGRALDEQLHKVQPPLDLGLVGERCR
jgi:hypothetical protein